MEANIILGQKPNPSASSEVKERFIRLKYLDIDSPNSNIKKSEPSCKELQRSK